MATVILVRHGRTTANATGLLAGRAVGPSGRRAVGPSASAWTRSGATRRR